MANITSDTKIAIINGDIDGDDKITLKDIQSCPLCDALVKFNTDYGIVACIEYEDVNNPDCSPPPVTDEKLVAMSGISIDFVRCIKWVRKPNGDWTRGIVGADTGWGSSGFSVVTVSLQESEIGDLPGGWVTQSEMCVEITNNNCVPYTYWGHGRALSQVTGQGPDNQWSTRILPGPGNQLGFQGSQQAIFDTIGGTNPAHDETEQISTQGLMTIQPQQTVKVSLISQFSRTTYTPNMFTGSNTLKSLGHSFRYWYAPEKDLGLLVKS